MKYKPSAWQSVFPPKRKRRTSEEVQAQQLKNKNLAAEYKTASPDRRAEILQEYYDGNKYWVESWPRWSREHWAELTQIFVSYWHEAFMRYNPTSEKSVFNFYMDRLYKSTASQDYKRWIKKEQANEGIEVNNPDLKDRGEHVRKEFFIHPQSDFDRALLRSKLCRNLDSHEMDVVERHFFENEALVDIIREKLSAEKGGYTIKQLSQAAYNFKKKNYEKILDKLSLNVSRDELRDLARQNCEDHPQKFETIYNTKYRREKYVLDEAA